MTRVPPAAPGAHATAAAAAASTEMGDLDAQTSTLVRVRSLAIPFRSSA